MDIMDELQLSLLSVAQRVIAALPAGKEMNKKKRSRGKQRGKKLCLTLNGFLIDLFRQSGKPLGIPCLMERVKAQIHALRRSDGSNYKGDLYKIVIGVLSNCSAFIDTPEGWTIDQPNARVYEESTLKNINRRLGKYRAGGTAVGRPREAGEMEDMKAWAQRLAKELREVEDWLTREDELLSSSFD